MRDAIYSVQGKEQMVDNIVETRAETAARNNRRFDFFRIEEIVFPRSRTYVRIRDVTTTSEGPSNNVRQYDVLIA